MIGWVISELAEIASFVDKGDELIGGNKMLGFKFVLGEVIHCCLISQRLKLLIAI
jgi:hypothetical protein